MASKSSESEYTSDPELVILYPLHQSGANRILQNVFRDDQSQLVVA